MRTSLSGILKVADKHDLPPSTQLNELKFGAGLFRRERSATMVDLRRWIKASIDRHHLTAEQGDTMVKNAMEYLKKAGPVTLSSLRLLHVNLRNDARIDVGPPANENDWDDIHDRFIAIFGGEDGTIDGIVAFKKIATAALGGNWDVEISKADGDQDGMVKVEFTDKTDSGTNFEFFLDQANKRILWRDTPAKRVPHDGPLFKQVAELLTTLVRRSVGGASSDNALQKAVLSVDKDFDQSRLDGLLIKDVFKRPDGFEVVLQDDAREEVKHRLAEMFEGGDLGLARIAAENLDGSWALRTSKVGGVDLHKDVYRGKVQDQGKVQVVFTDKRDPETRFEFILDQANKRILCGGDFAKWAEKGDLRAAQMTNLLTAVARSSKDIPSNDNASEVKALDRIEFKPGDVDTYALLINGYGNSCERGRYLLIMQLLGLFQKHRVDFEQIINGNNTEEVGKGLEKVEKISGEIDPIVMNKVGSTSIEDRSFVRTANQVAGVSESRKNTEDMLVSVSNTEPGDVLKIADIEEKLSLKNLRSVPELKSAADSLSKHYRTNVPLGRVLLELMSQKPDEETRNWVLVDLAPKTNLRLAPDAGQRVAGAGAGRPRIGKVAFLGGKKELSPEDQKDISKIHRSFNEMFGHNGIYAFRKLASEALDGDWEPGVSMAHGDHTDMVKVAFTDKNDPKVQFEFFLDDTGRRIVCGDDFAGWAVDGDLRAEQMTKLLTELVRYSKKHASDKDHALERAVFKVPSDVDPHSLLSNGYGASSELPEDGYIELPYVPTSELQGGDAGRQ